MGRPRAARPRDHVEHGDRLYQTCGLNSWNRDFYNALASKNWSAFTHAMIEFAALAFSYIFIVTARIWFRQLLEIR